MRGKAFPHSALLFGSFNITQPADVLSVRGGNLCAEDVRNRRMCVTIHLNHLQRMKQPLHCMCKDVQKFSSFMLTRFHNIFAIGKFNRSHYGHLNRADTARIGECATELFGDVVSSINTM